MKNKVFLFSLVMLFLFTSVVQAREVVVFIMDGVNLEELREVKTPNYDSLVKMGAVGLMNNKTAGSLDPVNTYLTIGSANRAKAGSEGYLSFNLEEEFKGVLAKDIYKQRVNQLTAETKIVNLSLAKLKKINANSDYKAKVGSLATSLGNKGLKIAVLGNADTYQRYRRHVALLAMNKYGIINHGDIAHQMRKKVSQYPSYYITNQSYLLSQLDKNLKTSDLIVIESGATSRIEAIQEDLVAKRFAVAKQNAIIRSDNLLAKVSQRLDFTKDYLIVISPTPAKKYANRGYKLTTALIVGPKTSGLLTSGTTKRLGLITNLDIAPSIYNYLVGDNQFEFAGQTLNSIPFEQPLSYLSSLNQQIQTTFSWRPLIVKTFIFFQIIIILLAGFILWYKDKFLVLKKFIIISSLVVVWLPTFFLFSKFFTSFSLSIVVSLWLVGSSMLAYLSYIIAVKNKLLAVVLPASSIVVTLVVDLWTGARLIKVSILGYSPVIGARFYGIGNEYMGLLIGATIILVMLLLEIRDKVSSWQLFIIFLFLIVTIGHPKLGANFGGLIASSVVCTLAYFYLQEYNLSYQSLVKVFLAVVGIVGIIVVIDINSGAKSHVARMLLRVKESGLEELLTIIYRKLEINLRLLQWTIWTKVLLAFIFILVILFKEPKGLVASIVEKYPYFSAGFNSLLLGSLVATIVNDSGVVVAATLLLLPVFSLVYLVFIQISFQKEGKKC